MAIEKFPTRLRGGYYDGAKLIGTHQGGDVASYYNSDSHGVVQFQYNEEKERLDAEFDPERPLDADESLVDHIRKVQESSSDRYEQLSEWAKEQLADANPD